MNLDFTASPSVEVLAATGVCFWIAGIGAPLAQAVFGQRPRRVWPFYAPTLGVVVVLLTTNLTAHAAPGAASTWLGLLAPSALSATIAWRSGAFRRGSRPATLGVLVLVVSSAGAFVFALINRTQIWFVDWAWHFALILRMARGVFPPVTPYGPDAGIGYHYGGDLLASSLVNAAGVMPWTALYVIQAFFVVALLLVAVGFAYDLGTPLPLAWGIGSALTFFPGQFNIGFLSHVELLVYDADAIHWLVVPHRALAVALVVLVAALLEAGNTRRQAMALAAAAGSFALAEAGVLLFSSVALAVVAVARLTRLRGVQMVALAGALIVAAALAAFAGGPVSDALLGRGGTAGMARVEFEPQTNDLLPFKLVENMLIQVGIIPLVMIGLVATFRRRSWGLSYLTASSILGLVAAEFVHSPLARNDGRIIWVTAAIAMYTALATVGTYIGDIKGIGRWLAILIVILFAIMPTGLTRAVSGVQRMSSGFYVRCQMHPDSDVCFLGRTQFDQKVEENLEFYAWLARFLPNDARLLTPNPAAAASLSGIASPTSGRELQVLAAYSTPVYDDALRFLNRDDLADMGITHLHVSEASAAMLTPQARLLLDDTRHFSLLADRQSLSGQRHRVFEVMRGAGASDARPSSFRFLRQMVSPDESIVLSRALSRHQRGSLLFLLIDNHDLRAPPSEFLDRATRIPRVELYSDIPDRGIVFLPESVEPNTLGLSRDSAFWSGYGIRAYDLATGWSSIWRVKADFAGMPASVRRRCESARGRLDIRVLGEPGAELVAGLRRVRLNGRPQQIQLNLADCGSPVFSSYEQVAPFVQIRSRRPGMHVSSASGIAGLGLDGGVDRDRAVVNIWYRNAGEVSFVTGTEIRLYKADPIGIAPAVPNLNSSLRWWRGPLVLASEEQMVRIEFDAGRLEVNGIAGVGGEEELELGRTYLLTLNIAGADPRSGVSEIQHQVPLVRVVVNDQGLSYDVLSGIVAVEDSELGAESRKWREGIAIG